MLEFSTCLKLMVWSAGVCVFATRYWKTSAFWSLVQISKRLLYAACCKISDFRRHLITFFFCEFLLCNYSVIIIQDARQGFIFISESWDLRVGRNVSSHIPPRIRR